MMRQCEKCGTWFVAKFDYVKLCYPCWQRRKDAETLVDELEEEVAQLRATNSQLRRQLDAPGDCRPSKSSAIPAEMVKLLLQLSHPDRHGNSVAANKATSWLLTQRPPR
jgi:hypothetical protein